MRIHVTKYSTLSKASIKNLLLNFDETGKSLFEGSRNTIKIVKTEGYSLNIKSFKKPNLFNKYVYSFIRKSKAQRSYNNALKLISKRIGTPKPIAFAEEVRAGALLSSFYISEQLSYDLTFRDIDLGKKNHEEILRAFTRFTFFLHENNVEFLDHSPGNTLIKLNNGTCEFFLVDLNRMNFKSLSFAERMKNFGRLSQDKKVFEVMANEYGKQINKPETEVLAKMLYYNQLFFNRRTRKRNVKNKLRKLRKMY